MLSFKNMPIQLYAKQTRRHFLVWSLWAGHTKALVTTFDSDWNEAKTEVIKFKQYHPKWCAPKFIVTEEEYQRMEKLAKLAIARHIPGFIKNITGSEGIIYERV